MKEFFIKACIFFVLVLIAVIFIFSSANGYTDPFYIRFTTSKQTSLILGTSRAAQGIQPEILNKILHRKDIFNYSFTIIDSPFGPTYLNSIKKKLNLKTKKGIFILSVDPWSISSKGDNPNDTISFIEKRRHLGRSRFVNMNPNFLYLLKNYDKSYINLFLLNDKSTFLHKDGWLEVTVNMDSDLVKNRILEKINDYKLNNLPFYKFSSKRLEYFIETIEFLKHYGNVYLVRLPVHPLMNQLDEELMPNFNFIIENISAEKHVPYLDLTKKNDRYLFTDGGHLFKDSGKIVSKEIAEWILTCNENTSK
jgi:hypothetical protein